MSTMSTVSASSSSASDGPNMQAQPFPNRMAPVLPPISSVPRPASPGLPSPALPQGDDAKMAPSPKDMAINIDDRRPPARLADDLHDDDMPRAEVESGIGLGLGGGGILSSAGSRAAQTRLETVAYVTQLPLNIQGAFRFKMLFILWIQLGLTLLVSLPVRLALPGKGIGYFFPAQSIQALLLVFAVFITLPLLTAVKDKHPWNMVATFFWTLLLGTALGASQIPGGFVLSNTFFIIFANLFVGIGILMVLCTQFTLVDEFGDRYLITFGAAGCFAWVIMVTGTIILACNAPHLYEQPGHIVGALLFTTCIFSWVCYDADQLCSRMQPDEYMKGVIYFYTDFIWVCLCCAILSIFSGSGAN